MEMFMHDSSKSWAATVLEDADKSTDPKWHGCHFYIDTPYITVCKTAGVQDTDLFRAFSEYGEKAVDDDNWMREWMSTHPLGGLAMFYAVIKPNVPRFEQFIAVSLPVPGRKLPPEERVVLPHVAMLPDDYDRDDDPHGTDIAKNGQGRIKYITGEIVEPDDSRWIDLKIKWPHLGGQ